MIDLHTHTNVSDGVLTPRELVDRAAAYSLKAIAICDHDSVGAYSSELVAYALERAVELIPGIELSTTTEDKRSYHIAGLFIDLGSSSLRSILERLQENRREYVAKAVAALVSEGFFVDETQVIVGVITKAHIARSVVRHPGNRERLVREFGVMPADGVFIETYMLPGQSCFVERQREFTPDMAIELIHQAGGLAFLAHPASYVIKGESLRDLCDALRQSGIDGFEAYNVQYDKSNGDREVDLSSDVAAYCDEFGLLQSGGSDFHTDDPVAMGNFIDLGFRGHPMKMPDELLVAMNRVLETKAAARNHLVRKSR